MLELLKKHFGYDAFRPLQEEIITHVVSGKDSLVLMPTGGGKSLCYQLPAMALPGITLVVSPLISLMKDQVDALTENGISSAYINSTLLLEEIFAIQERALSGELKLLYIAPERLAALDFREFLSCLRISLLAIDEAHCISEWGHDFRPDYRNLSTLRKQFPSVPVVALTATATERVRQDIVRQLNISSGKTFVSSFNRPNLQYSVQSKQQTYERLVKLLQKYKGESVIVYCFSRNSTEQLVDKLKRDGFSAEAYHAGLSAEVRKNAQENFIRDRVNIIVATIAFGMGIDKPDVRLVVHADLPKSIEGYYQETGRAGRDGLPSECVLFYSNADTRKQKMFIDELQDEEERRHAYQKLQLMVDFCERPECRRAFLLSYFGEQYAAPCNNCDRCLKPVEQYDATEIAQKILSAVLKSGERYGSGYVVRVLRGEKDERVSALGHDKLSVYGIAGSHKAAELKYVVQQLVSKGLLQEEAGMYPTLSLTTFGKNFLKERQSLSLPKRDVVEAPLRSGSEQVEYNPELFGQLRELRKELAESAGVPPYIIFGDKSLQEMAFYFPQSAESFLTISGVGRQKLESFGSKFLEVIKEFAAQNSLEEVVKQGSFSAPGSSSISGGTYEVTKQFVLEKLQPEEIAQKRGVTLGTIIQHLEVLVERGADISYITFPPERLKVIAQAFSENPSPLLKPIKELLGDDYSYDDLRLARLLLNNKVKTLLI